MTAGIILSLSALDINHHQLIFDKRCWILIAIYLKSSTCRPRHMAKQPYQDEGLFSAPNRKVEQKLKVFRGSFKRIQRQLLHWFALHQRNLPWRRDYSPYRIWIAEIMLQQTQAKTVVPYYERWMERFESIQEVAQAPVDEILKYWQGLGYYARAQYIHRTAGIIVTEYGGAFPSRHDDLLKLPGIGPYTAGAIMSIAFNKDYPVVDGNVRRVFSRLFNIAAPVGSQESRSFMLETAQKMLPKGKARSYNQALMELGALVCTPKTPECAACPLQADCESFRLNIVQQRPVPAARKASEQIETAVGVLCHDGKFFIQKRPPNGLMASLWEFPGGKLEKGETPEKALVREFCEELQIDVGDLRKIAIINHAYTRFRIKMHAFLCRLKHPDQKPVPRSAVEARWVERDELERYAFPAANHELIQHLKQRYHEPESNGDRDHQMVYIEKSTEQCGSTRSKDR